MGGVGGDEGEVFNALELDQLVHAGIDHAVADDADALVLDELIRDLLDLAADVHALGALVGDEQQVRHLVEHAAADLLDAGLAVDDDIVKVAGEHADDFLQIGVDGAVAARRLGAADGEEGEALALDHRVEDAEACLVEDLDGLTVLAALGDLDDLVADIVERVGDGDAQRGRETDRGVGVDGEDALAGVRVHKLADDGGAETRLADAALARYGNDFGFGLGFFHSVPSR